MNKVASNLHEIEKQLFPDAELLSPPRRRRPSTGKQRPVNKRFSHGLCKDFADTLTVNKLANTNSNQIISDAIYPKLGE
jgi:hypothetical protein